MKGNSELGSVASSVYSSLISAGCVPFIQIAWSQPKPAISDWWIEVYSFEGGVDAETNVTSRKHSIYGDA